MPDELINNTLLSLGDCAKGQGLLDEAEAYYQEVEQVGRHPTPEQRWMLWRSSQHLFHSYDELWLVRGDPDKALAYADECLALAEPTAARAAARHSAAVHKRTEKSHCRSVR